jgi:hypothetical protein
MHTSFKRNVETRNHTVQFKFIIENIHFLLLVLMFRARENQFFKFDSFSKCGKTLFSELWGQRGSRNMTIFKLAQGLKSKN